MELLNFKSHYNLDADIQQSGIYETTHQGEFVDTHIHSNQGQGQIDKNKVGRPSSREASTATAAGKTVSHVWTTPHWSFPTNFNNAFYNP
jgi:hypothetical protein